MITQEDIKEYKAIYKEEFNEEISDKDAMDQATGLLNLYAIIYRPVETEKKIESRDVIHQTFHPSCCKK